ncbi:5-formyltetrahydrofolate cyclo-ligase [Candidatus Latescibacterota bacterium]
MNINYAKKCDFIKNNAFIEDKWIINCYLIVNYYLKLIKFFHEIIMNNKKEKNIIRSRIKKMRSEISIGTFRNHSHSIINTCIGLEEWQYAKTVHIYVSGINNEVETLGLIYMMFDSGKIVVVPKCNIELRKTVNIRISSFDELSLSEYGIMEPEYKSENEIQPENIDIVLVPLLAFDRNGGRVGFGGGYYDELLSKCNCVKVGLAYSFQEIDEVPVEPHDVPLDIIVTEKETIRIIHE